MIIALAGHVDHGKTSLVHALSGVNTDQLEEEKRRGLTIDLGFAYIDDGNIGFVDVPGHHKFIHNMVAGIASDQVAMLVIAADDGPMPQSKEHLDILQLLGVTGGLVVMSKCDRVSPARQDECRTEIKSLLTGSFLAQAPVFATSIENPESYKIVLAHIRDLATKFEQPSEGMFRLAIDRRFTVKGSGVVVTGTVHDGTVRVDEQLHLFPSNKQARVRGLRAQDQQVQTASQGERCAINLTGISLEEISRGDWLSATPASPYCEVTLELQVLQDFPRPIKQWTPVHVYHATSHVRGHIALLDQHRLNPGDRTLVDVVLDEAIAVQSGDQIVVRDHGLDTTLGGGRVVYASTTQTPRRRNHQRLAQVHAFAKGDPKDALTELLANQHTPNITDFRAFWQLDDQQTTALLNQCSALMLNNHIIAKSHLGNLAKAGLDEMTGHAKANPDSMGLKENDFTSLPNVFASQVLGALVKTGKLAVNAGVYTPTDHQASLPSELARRYDQLKDVLNSLQPPSSGDLAKTWNVPLKDLEAQMRDLSKRGLLVYICDHRYFLPSQIQAIADRVKAMATKTPFTVREFRDATGIGRNVAIDLLEYFDGKGFTRRQDNHRMLLRDTL